MNGPGQAPPESDADQPARDVAPLLEDAVARAPWRRWLRVLPLVVLVVLSLGLLVGGAPRWFTLDHLLASRDLAQAVVAENRPRAVLGAYLFYVGTVVVSVPVSVVLTMLCGFLFGTVTGALVAIASATTGAVIVFGIGRTAAGELLLKHAGPRLRRLAEGFREDAFSYVLFLRLLPIFPFWMTNLGPAVFGVRLRTFALATFLGISPGAFIYAATGARIEAVAAAHKEARAACLAAGEAPCDDAISLRQIVTPGMIATLAGLGALALLPVVVRRLRRKPG